jgi:hypothetical protein
VVSFGLRLCTFSATHIDWTGTAVLERDYGKNRKRKGRTKKKRSIFLSRGGYKIERKCRVKGADPCFDKNYLPKEVITLMFPKLVSSG